MPRLKNDLYGLHCPLFYRAEIVRDEDSSYVAELGNTHVFTGYYTNNSDILYSKSLIMIKVAQLQDDPRVVDNGNGHVKLYLVDGIKCQQLLVYDSSQSYKGTRGINRPIIDNLKKEIDVLWDFIDTPSQHIFLVKDEGETHPYLSPYWGEDDVNRQFLKPLSDDAWEFKFVGIDEARQMTEAQEQDAKFGVYWMHGKYIPCQVESKDAA